MLWGDSTRGARRGGDLGQWGGAGCVLVRGDCAGGAVEEEKSMEEGVRVAATRGDGAGVLPGVGLCVIWLEEEDKGGVREQREEMGCTWEVSCVVRGRATVGVLRFRKSGSKRATEPKIKGVDAVARVEECPHGLGSAMVCLLYTSPSPRDS